MKLLLDTHVLLWALEDSPRLPFEIREEIISENNEVYVSVASLWEIAIKQSLGKLDSELSLSDLDEQCQLAGLRRIAIDIAHLERIKTLPDVHRDPFDRLLVAQALEEELVVITCDGLIPRYPVQTIW